MYNLTFILKHDGETEQVTQEVTCLHDIFDHVKTLFAFLELDEIITVPTTDLLENNMNSALYFSERDNKILCTKFLAYVE